jgi:ribosomal protein S4E
MKKYKKHIMPDGTFYLTNMDGSFAKFENGDIINESDVETLEKPEEHIIKHHNYYRDKKVINYL